MQLEAHLIQLEAWTQTEIAAQERMLALLADQEAAIGAGQSADLAASSKAIEAELCRGPRRERERAQLMRRIATTLGVAPDVLTLSSIVERAENTGVGAERLAGRRDELRRATAAVLNKGRQIASLARYHTGLMEELMQLLIEDSVTDAPPAGESRGTLVDATA